MNDSTYAERAAQALETANTLAAEPGRPDADRHRDAQTAALVGIGYAILAVVVKN